MKARIKGTASYLPKKVLKNDDLEKMVETSDEWIVSRTGMKERRIAAKDEYASDMGAIAAKKVLKASGVSPDKVEAILVGTMTPDYPTPSTAAIIQKKISASNAFAMDFHAACSGYLYGLSMAKAYIESGMYRNILLVVTEKLSSIINYKDRNTCILFGDGAAASLIVDKGEGLEISNIHLGADGEQAGLLQVSAGGCCHPATEETVLNKKHCMEMNGKELFKHAVRRMEGAVKSCLDSSSIREEELSWLIPHQANSRIIDGLAKRFSLPLERVYRVIHKYGNTSASSVPIALYDLMNEKAVKEGENLMLVAFGAGLTWGASVLKKVLK